MATRSPVASKLHQDLVQFAVDKIQRLHPYVRVHADLDGYPCPDKITWAGKDWGHIPDVMSRTHIVEVETDDSLESDHALSQFKLFAAFAHQNSKTFAVVVPPGREQRARIVLNRLGLAGEVW